jgi:hypothetical protein
LSAWRVTRRSCRKQAGRITRGAKSINKRCGGKPQGLQR